MKKFLVPVNFSPAAENAAYFASAFACKIGASVELVHILPLPVQTPLASSLHFPEDEFERLSADSEKKLDELSKSLSQKIRDAYEVLDFKPNIYGRSILGNVTEEVSKRFESERMNLVVMGISKAPRINRVFGGSTVRSAIESCELPLLLIPESFKYRKFKKIAFASDLNMRDIDLIAIVAELMRPFDADILITHSKDPREDYQKLADVFLKQLSSKVNYPNIYFREVISKSVDDGIDYVLTSSQIDMLVMVHNHHSFFQDLFVGSSTKRISDHIQIPLLVFPPDQKKLI